MTRRALRELVKVAAAAGDLTRPRRRGAVVLIYHRVGGTSSMQVDLHPALFGRQMEALAESGRVTTLDDALAVLQNGQLPASDPVVISFDDGSADFVDAALPILDRHRLPATLYLTTGFVDGAMAVPHGGRPLSWRAVGDALSSGLVTLGSHTHSHTLLDRVPVKTVEYELQRSIDLIGEHAGVAVEHFAYPKALVASAAAEPAVRRRFRSAALAGTRPNPYGRTDPYRLHRSPIQVADGLRWFRRKLAGGMALEDDLRRLANRRRYRGAVQ